MLNTITPARVLSGHVHAKHGRCHGHRQTRLVTDPEVVADLVVLYHGAEAERNLLVGGVARRLVKAAQDLLLVEDIQFVLFDAVSEAQGVALFFLLEKEVFQIVRNVVWRLELANVNKKCREWARLIVRVI